MGKRERELAIAGLVCLAVGWWLASSPASPVRPEPPQPERPVLRFIAKVAKGFLWAMAFAEPQPEELPTHLVHARVDADGHEVLNHGQGW